MNLVRTSTEIENVKKNQSELKNKIMGKMHYRKSAAYEMMQKNEWISNI